MIILQINFFLNHDSYFDIYLELQAVLCLYILSTKKLKGFTFNHFTEDMKRGKNKTLISKGKSF